MTSLHYKITFKNQN